MVYKTMKNNAHIYLFPGVFIQITTDNVIKQVSTNYILTHKMHSL